MEINDINFNNKEPIYLQIVEYIKKKIINGELECGSKLPSVREMATIMSVNPNTLQRAYGELERLGLTHTKRGMGSFIIEDEEILDSMRVEVAKETIEKFLNDMKSMGIPKNKVIKLIEKMEGEIKNDKTN